VARQRGIVVEYSLFDHCSLEDKKGELAWARNPLSALNNNGGALPGKKGKPDIYAFADYGDLTLFQTPLDPSWSWQKKNQWYQQLYVKYTIEQVTGFSNIHWEIMNEQGWQRVEPGGPEWTRHWLDFLDRHDPNRRLRSINAADVYDAMPGLDIVCEHPIPFFHRRELTDPEAAVGIIAANLKFGKPVICDETGYFPPPASTEDEIWRTVTREQLANERRAFWYAFVAGGHWTAVCWQDFQERDTHRWVRHLKSLTDAVPYWKMDPHDELVDRGHCLALPNGHYVIYLGTGGTTTLQLGDRTADAFVCEWIDPRSGERRVAMPEVQGRKSTFTAPSDDDWAICIRAR
jgi:hypothetical protein